jgi:membrane-bound ClpP family serine protease
MATATTIVLGVCFVLVTTVIVAVSRHKKSATGVVTLVGSAGMVETTLDPYGTVLIRGEIWRACSSDGTMLTQASIVRVIGTRDHFLLVKLRDQ